MKIGIIETGGPPPALLPQFGSYAGMIRRLWGSSFDYEVFDVRENCWPRAPEACEGYVITGSAAGVYEDHHWIEPLKSFIRRAAGRTALIGICFGHQIMAEAFGGRVARSARGWSIGLHRYAILTPPDWIDACAAISIPASHRDQVIEPPPNATVIAASDFTPFAAFDYPSLRAVSFQGHPEFTTEYARALIELRRGTVFDEALAEAGLLSLQQASEGRRVARWLERFLKSEVIAA